MPETGVRAPARMLVAVRAMAPVAGRPPNIGDAMLAMPCATSSMFGLCRSPPIRSATTADSSDSIAPSIATVIAGRRSVGISSGWKPEWPGGAVPTGCRRTGCRPCRSAGPNTIATAVPADAARRWRPESWAAHVRSTIIPASDTTPNAVAGGESVSDAAAPGPPCARRTRTAPAATASPKKSRICVLAISTAIPFVNPITTGRGRYFTAVPMPVRPSTTRMTPGHHRAP